MSSLLLMNVLDAALALGEEPLSATPEGVADWVKKNYLAKKITPYNYDLPIRLLVEGFRGSLAKEGALAIAEARGHPLARKHFRAVIESCWPYVAEHPSSVYPVGFLAVPVGRVGRDRVFVSTKAPLVRVEHGRPYLVMPQFRRSARPMRRQIDMILSFAREQALREGYRNFDVEFIESAPIGKGVDRLSQVTLASTRSLFSTDALDGMLQVFVAGISLLHREGMTMGKPDFSGLRVVDPDQSGLF